MENGAKAHDFPFGKFISVLPQLFCGFLCVQSKKLIILKNFNINFTLQIFFFMFAYWKLFFFLLPIFFFCFSLLLSHINVLILILHFFLLFVVHGYNRDLLYHAASQIKYKSNNIKLMKSSFYSLFSFCFLFFHSNNLKHYVGSKGIGNRFDEQRLTLRIHRGRGSNFHESPHSNGSTTTSLGSASPERLSRFATRKHEKVKISVSYPSSENISSPTNNQTSNQLYAVHYSVNGKETQASHLFRGNSGRGNINSNSIHNNKDYLNVVEKEKFSSPRASKKMGKRNIKAQVKRFRMETKAAKTLAIIVGMFVLCWLPFFTMYLLRPFCDDCINPVLFSIAFWIGYCNSAINPMIYALFSKDFRFAFKRIICKFFCSGPGFQNPPSRRGSDMSAFRHGGGGTRTPSISPSAMAQSIGDDSDPIPEDQSR